MTDYISYSLVVTDPTIGQPTIATAPVRPTGESSTLDRHIERLKDADWSKSNYRLSVEFSVPSLKVAEVRRHLGKPKSVNEIRAFFLSLDWSKQNCQLAEEHKRSPTTIYRWRKLLGKENPQTHWTHRTHSSDKWEHILDWSKRDVVLGREHGMTRERVRQLRIRFNKPKVKKLSDSFVEFKAKYADALEVDPDLAATQFGEPRRKILNWCGYLGLSCKRKNHKSIYPWQSVDWRMPTPTISEIWGAPLFSVRAMRFRKSKPLAGWRVGSKLTQEQLDIINQQKQLAKQLCTPPP